MFLGEAQSAVREQLEIRSNSGCVLAALLDLSWVRSAEVDGHVQVFDFGRIDAHDATAGGVDRNEVFAKDQDASLFGRSLDGSVPFHTDDAIDDGKGPTELAIEGDDGFGDSDLMEGIFRPAVDGTGNEAEEVFHREGGPGPVMGLHFGHGDDEISGEDGIGEEKLSLTSEVFDGADVVAIQVDKIVFKVLDALPIAGFVGEAEGIAAVARTFSDGDRGGPERAECVEGGSNQRYIRIDGGGGVKLDEVGL